MKERVWRNPVDKRPLAEQVFDIIVRDIRNGSIPVGSAIPSVRSISASFGVSHVVAWKAMRRLVEEGLVAASRSAGAVVLPVGGHVWRGRVLMIERDSAGSYYAAVMAERISQGLSDAGYVLEREVLMCDADGNLDFARVDLKLNDPVRLVLQMHEDVRISRHLAKFDVPVVCVARSRKRIPGAVGVIRSNHLSSAAVFASMCRASGCRSVWQIGLASHREEALVLCKAGLKVRELVFAPGKGNGHELEATQRAALCGAERMFAKGTPRWPDVLRFTDDFTASGFLQGLLIHGVKIPEDVRVVSLSNRGFGPVFYKTLAREEMDPFSHGKSVAEYVTKYLRTGEIPDSLTLDSVFRAGETFPF